MRNDPDLNDSIAGLFFYRYKPSTMVDWPLTIAAGFLGRNRPYPTTTFEHPIVEFASRLVREKLNLSGGNANFVFGQIETGVEETRELVIDRGFYGVWEAHSKSPELQKQKVINLNNLVLSSQNLLFGAFLAIFGLILKEYFPGDLGAVRDSFMNSLKPMYRPLVNLLALAFGTWSIYELALKPTYLTTLNSARLLDYLRSMDEIGRMYAKPTAPDSNIPIGSAVMAFSWCYGARLNNHPSILKEVYNKFPDSKPFLEKLDNFLSPMTVEERIEYLLKEGQDLLKKYDGRNDPFKIDPNRIVTFPVSNLASHEVIFRRNLATILAYLIANGQVPYSYSQIKSTEDLLTQGNKGLIELVLNAYRENQGLKVILEELRIHPNSTEDPILRAYNLWPSESDQFMRQTALVVYICHLHQKIKALGGGVYSRKALSSYRGPGNIFNEDLYPLTHYRSSVLEEMIDQTKKRFPIT